MPRSSRIRGLLLLTLLLCGTQAVRALASRPVVVSSIRPLQLIVLALAADQVEASEFPGVGASAHDFVVRPSAIRLLESASLVFWIGPELERPLGELLERMPVRHDCALLPTLPPKLLLADADPHVWLDPRIARELARSMAGFLIDRVPLDAQRLHERLDAFDAAMQTVETRMHAELRGLDDVPFIVMHDGYGYFVHRFGLARMLALGPDAEHLPGARAISRMRAAARRSGARCLLRESNSNARLVETLVEGSGLRVREVDPLALTAAEDDTGFARFLGDFTAAVAGCLREPDS